MSWQDKFLSISKQSKKQTSSNVSNKISSVTNKSSVLVTKKDKVSNKASKSIHQVSNKNLDVTNKTTTTIIRPTKPKKSSNNFNKLPSFIKIERKLMELYREGIMTPTEKKLYERLVKRPHRDRWIVEKILDFIGEYF